jgi:hypothetical protein
VGVASGLDSPPDEGGANAKAGEDLGQLADVTEEVAGKPG